MSVAWIGLVTLDATLVPYVMYFGKQCDLLLRPNTLQPQKE